MAKISNNKMKNRTILFCIEKMFVGQFIQLTNGVEVTKHSYEIIEYLCCKMKSHLSASIAQIWYH